MRYADRFPVLIFVFDGISMLKERVLSIFLLNVDNDTKSLSNTIKDRLTGELLLGVVINEGKLFGLIFK